MAFGIVVNGVSIPDEKVIAVHDLANHVSPAVVGTKVGLLKSQVIEVRKWLRAGLADEIKNMKASPSKQSSTKPLPRTINQQPRRSNESVLKVKQPTALSVLGAIASSSARVYMKDVIASTRCDDRKRMQEILRGLRSQLLVEYKGPGTYSPTLKGIKHLKQRDPDCKVHEKAQARANGYDANKMDSEPKGKPVKQWAEKNTPKPEKQKPVKYTVGEVKEYNPVKSIENHLSDVDAIFEKQALQKLQTQVELLGKIHALTGKLAEEISGSIAELSEFMKDEG